MSIGGVLALALLSTFAPVWASILMLLLVVMMFAKAAGMAFRTIQGYLLYKKANTIHWDKRLKNL